MFRVEILSRNSYIHFMVIISYLGDGLSMYVWRIRNPKRTTMSIGPLDRHNRANIMPSALERVHQKANDKHTNEDNHTPIEISRRRETTGRPKKCNNPTKPSEYVPDDLDRDYQNFALTLTESSRLYIFQNATVSHTR